MDSKTREKILHDVKSSDIWEMVSPVFDQLPDDELMRTADGFWTRSMTTSITFSRSY